MGEYRERKTGEVKSQGEWRASFPNMSIPKIWHSGICDLLNLDPVLASPAATVGAYQYSARDGVEQDSKGNWVEKYVARDMFTDTTEDGVTTTKAEHEATYQATLDANTATANRATRDAKLAETDFYALSDVTMSSEMQSFRQSLRDITTHENWPNLEDADWPTAP
jgi:hypothetical protein|tara:strand:- start:254 stop:751 length:498 start_codon:yes stop_codon:yes gene_type:complete